MRILYVEDDPTAEAYIAKGLGEQGYKVDVARDGDEGLDRALEVEYDLLVLDVMLPGRDGFEVLRELRARGVTTPTIFLSARGEVGDRVTGLDLGADDYLRKPFAFSELLARIRAVTRRREVAPVDGVRRVADLELDVRRRRVNRGGMAISLTAKEFALLECLMESEGIPLSRKMIIEEVWGYDFDSYSNVIDVHINHLRRKIDRDHDVKLIHTVKNVGYVLEDRGADQGPD
jgi:two-component system copper resistance phosphate regulon response regulator CusR